MRLVLMFLALVVPPPVLAQGEWDSFRAEGWQGARICPFGEIVDGGYFCLELACPDGGPLGFRIRLTEAELQPFVEAMWTVNRREAGEIVLAPLEGAPGHYFAPYDDQRDAALIERMRQGSEGSLTIVNRSIRAVRPFGLRGSFGPIAAALRTCPLEMPQGEVTVTPAAEDLLEVIPADPAVGNVIELRPAEPDDVILVVPADSGPAVEAVLPAGPEDDATEAAPPSDMDASSAQPGSDADAPASAEAEAEAESPREGDSPPPGPLVAEDGSVSDPAAFVLQEIETACIERGGTFVEVREDFVRRADFDGDGYPDMEVSYSGAVCDAAAGLYCDTDSCLTRLYLGREDGRFVVAFEDVYMSARTVPSFVVTYMPGSSACPEAVAPCEKVFVWQEGALVPAEVPQP